MPLVSPDDEMAHVREVFMSSAAVPRHVRSPVKAKQYSKQSIAQRSGVA